LSKHIRTLGLSEQERLQLKAFLGTLKGEAFWIEPPPELE
jgi:hypothetical protein